MTTATGTIEALIKKREKLMEKGRKHAMFLANDDFTRNEVELIGAMEPADRRKYLKKNWPLLVSLYDDLPDNEMQTYYLLFITEWAALFSQRVHEMPMKEWRKDLADGKAPCHAIHYEPDPTKKKEADESRAKKTTKRTKKAAAKPKEESKPVEEKKAPDWPKIAAAVFSKPTALADAIAVITEKLANGTTDADVKAALKVEFQTLKKAGRLSITADGDRKLYHVATG